MLSSSTSVKCIAELDQMLASAMKSSNLPMSIETSTSHIRDRSVSHYIEGNERTVTADSLSSYFSIFDLDFIENNPEKQMRYDFDLDAPTSFLDDLPSWMGMDFSSRQQESFTPLTDKESQQIKEYGTFPPLKVSATSFQNSSHEPHQNQIQPYMIDNDISRHIVYAPNIINLPIGQYSYDYQSESHDSMHSSTESNGSNRGFWTERDIENIKEDTTNPIGKFLRESKLSNEEIIRMDLMSSLAQFPRKVRQRYGPRKLLTAEQRIQQAKERNKFHARATRLRKKMFKQTLEMKKKSNSYVGFIENENTNNKKTV